MKLGEILLIVLVVVLIFGAARLPQLGKAIGEGFKELKKGLREAEEEDQTAREKPTGTRPKRNTGKRTSAAQKRSVKKAPVKKRAASKK